MVYAGYSVYFRPHDKLQRKLIRFKKIMKKVAAGIIEKDGKILIAHRKTGKCVGQNWEFPGGKLEDGETPEECLKRELKEELDIDVEILSYFTTGIFYCGENLCHTDESKIELMAYKVKYLSGEVKLVDHDDYKWVFPQELKDYIFTIPDRPIVEKILQNLLT